MVPLLLCRDYLDDRTACQQPRDRGVTDVEATADIAARLTAGMASYRLCDLVGRQFRLAAEPYPTGHGTRASLSGAGKDQAALELGKACEDRHHEPPVRCRGIGPMVCEGFEARALLADRVEGVQQIPG